ncbi:MAG: hypothetical protein FWG07_09905 [Treponema sp.]|nr:hypothetical protein [Treponema sp.]
MKTKLYLIATLLLCCSLSGCNNPWYGKIVGPLIEGYDIGDTGPGGGIIFYRSNNVFGFIMTDTGKTCYYLEAAPVAQGTSLAWASKEYDRTDIPGTSFTIGSGRQNTARILAIDANAPAALACKNYNGGGKTDWFLPSSDEFDEFYIFYVANGKGTYGNLSPVAYWSSSQGNYAGPWMKHFGNCVRRQTYKESILSVRAIRAF